jgi:hypothetical protein
LDIASKLHSMKKITRNKYLQIKEELTFAGWKCCAVIWWEELQHPPFSLQKQ